MGTEGSRLLLGMGGEPQAFLWFVPRDPGRKEDGPRLENLSSQGWAHWQPEKVQCIPVLPSWDQATGIIVCFQPDLVYSHGILHDTGVHSFPGTPSWMLLEALKMTPGRKRQQGSTEPADKSYLGPGGFQRWFIHSHRF